MNISAYDFIMKELTTHTVSTWKYIPRLIKKRQLNVIYNPKYFI
ncbi:Uncharacterised protein [Yersinia pseudotuberculosis]|uniref:Uncharacterized protein n=1 Tax=Yersinia pekkanenii TaxID=1288385 RepID=A0A0T9R9M5_9GAMM|nr:hypothetical protein BZ20_2950 [Yersinia pseudotuberculosis]CNI51666.1 Uncharacterised protein [Yersinia pekkanenii]CNK17392.1 Uncharacterised protein [Yersinia pseudotuberculosis]CNK34181.1 Uncharacterised protein [Yersinia pseudotuberculosis]CRY67720.1 Uncharacterised protein [Yersinia pekkanenii]